MTVVRMLSATLIGRVEDAEAILSDVQAAGLLHIEPIRVPSDVAGDADSALQETRRLTDLRHSIASLSVDGPLPAEDGLPLGAVVQTVSKLGESAETLRRSIARLDGQIAQLKPWGQLDPSDVAAIRNAGVPVILSVVTEPLWQTLDLSDAVDAGRLAYHVCQRHDDELWVCLLGDAAPDFGLTEQRLPSEPLAVVSARRDKLNQDLHELQREIAGFSGYLQQIDARMDALADRAAVLQCRDTAVLEPPVFAVRGYIPAESQNDLQAAVADHACAMQVSDPAPGEVVPVKLRNNAVVQGFESIMRSFSGITYWEKDFTWAVGILFAVFGSLCLLDAGYAVLLAITGGVLLSKGQRDFGRVFLLTGLFSFVVGIAGGQFFGLIVGRDFLVGVQPPTPLAADPLSCLVFSLVVGIVALAFSYGMAIWQRGIATDATGSLIVVVAAMVMIGAPELGATVGVAMNLPISELDAMIEQANTIGQGVGGVLLIFGLLAWIAWPDRVFGDNRIANAIWTVYSGVTGLAQDTMSHMRLFGIALSGSIMAMVINNISGQLPVGATVAFAIIGHVAVYGLALLSLYIHTNRLIFLEFGSKCIDGGQKWYTPLSRRRTVEA